MKRPLALFTITRNESFFFPLWLRHYSATGGDIFVLDHESDDGSTSGKGFVRVPISRPETDDVGWMLATVESFFKELLKTHERVVFAEVDEFLVPDPVFFHSLKNYLENRRSSVITACGFDVCGNPDSPPLDPTKPILAQRGWKRNERYDKTLISGVPMSWEVGFHRVNGMSQDPDSTLRLIHLHYIDLEVAWNRLTSRMKGRNPAPGEWGWQNKIQNREEFDRHFASVVGGCEPIPERFHGSIL